MRALWTRLQEVRQCPVFLGRYLSVTTCYRGFSPTSVRSRAPRYARLQRRHGVQKMRNLFTGKQRRKVQKHQTSENGVR